MGRSPRAFPVLLHALGLAAAVYCLFLVHNFAPMAMIAESYGGHFNFLTIQGLCISLATFAVAILDELFRNSCIRKVKHFLLALAFPLEVSISLLYWTIVFYDAELLLMPGVQRIPIVLDIGLHLLPAVILLADLLLISNTFQKSSSHTVVIMTYSILYGVWVHYVFAINQFWPYPFFALMTAKQRLAVFVSGALLTVSVYLIGARLHKLSHGARRRIAESSSKSRLEMLKTKAATSE